MDYQKEYIQNNPGLALDEAEIKAQQVLNFLGRIKIKSLLDVACGAGGITKIIQRELKTTRTIGLDISKIMIETAINNDTSGKVNWICKDLFTYQTDQKSDLVTGIDIIEHIPDDLKTLKKMATLGKLILIKTPMENSFVDRTVRTLGINDSWKESERKYGHVHHYNEKELIKLFKDAKLKIVKDGYIPLPRRSKPLYEFLRIIFLPIGWFSPKAMANIVGGFKIALLEPINIQ